MSAPEQARHLVLGGSAGIGFAYAERYARRGDELCIVARRVAGLEAARRALLAQGAARVETMTCDLADPTAREPLLAGLSGTAPFRTVFVGGPGPVPGRADEVSEEDHARAREACVAYPGRVIGMADRLVERGGKLVLLSSSATAEPLDDHRFYLSALYRRQLDELIAATAQQFHAARLAVSVLKPKVVLTHHSQAFARSIDTSRDAASVLAEYFAAPEVPSARTFVERAEDSALDS